MAELWSVAGLALGIGVILGILFMWGVGAWAASIVRRESKR